MEASIIGQATFTFSRGCWQLGGAPWSVEVPLSGLMVIGYDVCHDTRSKEKSFGAMVATLDKQMTQYYSTVNAHTSGEELSSHMAFNIGKAIDKYRERNGQLDVLHHTVTIQLLLGATLILRSFNFFYFTRKLTVPLFSWNISWKSWNISRSKFYPYFSGTLPTKILIYRDGVGDGQIPYVAQHEVCILYKIDA